MTLMKTVSFAVVSGFLPLSILWAAPSADNPSSQGLGDRPVLLADDKEAPGASGKAKAEESSDDEKSSPEDKAAQFQVSPESMKAILVFKTEDGGQGTGFIVRRKVNETDRFFVYTNQHIVAGGKTLPKAYRLDGSEVKLGRLFTAKGSDVALFPLDKPEPHFVELQSDVMTTVTSGHKLATPGNSGGGSTITLKYGKVVAVGPALVEIDSKIKGGNSGGPIIHENGKVIGIVAFFKQETKDDPRIKKEQELVIRRFGYRLDNIKNEDWVAPDWGRFVLQGERFEKVEKFTADLIETHNSGLKTWGGNEDLGRILSEFESGRSKAINEKMYYGRLSEVTVKLRDMCLVDVNALGREDLYWWWQHNLERERKVRQDLHARFDKLQKQFNQKR